MCPNSISTVTSRLYWKQLTGDSSHKDILGEKQKKRLLAVLDIKTVVYYLSTEMTVQQKTASSFPMPYTASQDFW